MSMSRPATCPRHAQPAGQLYLGQPTAQDTYRLFIAFEIVDGLWTKQVGVSKPDPNTGQITTTFDDLPSLPFTKTTLHLEKPNGTPLLVNPGELRIAHDHFGADPGPRAT